LLRKQFFDISKEQPFAFTDSKTCREFAKHRKILKGRPTNSKHGANFARVQKSLLGNVHIFDF
jgi:hypothetical protein